MLTKVKCCSAAAGINPSTTFGGPPPFRQGRQPNFTSFYTVITDFVYFIINACTSLAACALVAYALGAKLPSPVPFMIPAWVRVLTADFA